MARNGAFKECGYRYTGASAALPVTLPIHPQVLAYVRITALSALGNKYRKYERKRRLCGQNGGC
jgi:hypothetical protein